MEDLKSLAAAAERDGWASGSGDMETVRAEAGKLGWQEIAPRRGDATVSVLRPTTVIEARPKSLSRTYGLGAQALHTDGAHHVKPPDVLILASSKPSSTPTLLYRLGLFSRLNTLSHDLAANGMFLVQNGRDSFFAPVYDDGNYRYDPGCMTPCDVRAHEVAQYMAEAVERATAHEWSRLEEILVIANRRTVHARAALADGDGDRELTRVAFRIGKAK